MEAGGVSQWTEEDKRIALMEAQVQALRNARDARRAAEGTGGVAPVAGTTPSLSTPGSSQPPIGGAVDASAPPKIQQYFGDGPDKDKMHQREAQARREAERKAEEEAARKAAAERCQEEDTEQWRRAAKQVSLQSEGMTAEQVQAMKAGGVELPSGQMQLFPMAKGHSGYRPPHMQPMMPVASKPIPPQMMPPSLRPPPVKVTVESTTTSGEERTAAAPLILPQKGKWGDMQLPQPVMPPPSDAGGTAAGAGGADRGPPSDQTEAGWERQKQGRKEKRRPAQHRAVGTKL